MELDFDYKEGCYLFSGTSFPEVVIHKTIYKLVTITFQEYGAYKPFSFKVFDLTNKLDIEILNEKYKRTMSEQDPDERYNVRLGTIVEYDYLKLIYLGITDKKILSFVLQRPVLFDYIKARDKYLVADALDTLWSLHGEFSTTWEQYFRIPLDSKEKIEWEIISPPVPLKANVNENLLKDEFGNSFTDSITVYDFLNVIDTDTFNKIPNQEIKDEISKLIKKTLEIAKENSAIGKEDPNKKPAIQEPISAVPKDEVVDENATKTLYKINVVISAMDKDGGQKYPKIYDVYADSETEALEKIRKQFNDDEEFKLNDLYYDYDEVVEVIPPSKKEPILEKIVKKAISRKKKKTQEQIFKEIDEVDPENLLSLLDEI